MLKAKAIELLGGSVAAAADAIGVTYQAVDKWPDVLPSRIADRVIAVIARRELPPEKLGLDAELPGPASDAGSAAEPGGATQQAAA